MVIDNDSIIRLGIDQNIDTHYETDNEVLRSKINQ